MSKEPEYRLASNTVVEPLINNWLAWSFVVAPVPASLHLVEYQIRALKSYLQDPQSHVKASRDPNLMGGPFVNIAAERAGEVKQLLDDTEKQQADNIKLARALTDFHNRLSSEAKGQSLEPYYKKIPEPLRGYVELVYDYYSNPIVRLQENMLYRSEHYKPEMQSLRLARLDRDDSRPFFMSTPRLPQADQFDWRIPFDDDRVDAFFNLDRKPRRLAEIGELLGLSAERVEQVVPLLSEEDRPLPERWQGEAVRVKYFGHACVLVEWQGQSILTDPFIAAVPGQAAVERFSYSDLPEQIDYVLITHNHCDHFLLESLLRLRGRIGCLVVPRSYGYLYGDVSLKKMARRLGFKQVEELDTLESIKLKDGEIVAVPFMGEHGDLGHGKTAYVVRAGREQMLFAADSDCLDRRAYDHIRKFIGPVQSVFLGTECVGAPLSWSYGPLFLRKPTHAHDQSRKQRGSDSVAGLNILDALGSNRFYNYGMGQEPWVEHILALALPENSPQIREANKIIEKCREKGFLAAERLFGKAEFFLTGEDSGARSFVSLSERKTVSPRLAAAQASEAERRLDSPLSFTQQRLWSLAESQTPFASSNITALIRLDGPLEVAALHESVNEIVNRHQILRTAIRQVKGEIVQMVAPSQRLLLPVTDLNIEEDSDRVARINELIAERTRKGFDLKQPLMLNAELLRFGSERHILLLTLARIAADEYSVVILTKEIADLYKRVKRGDAARLPDAANPYFIFAESERQSFESGNWHDEMHYWKHRLSGSTSALNLAPGRLREQAQSIQRAESPIVIDNELSRMAASAGIRLGYSLQAILMAAFTALLYRHSGQPDFIVGIKLPRRDHDQTQGMVGPLATLAALRTDLSDDPSFLMLLERVEGEYKAACVHQQGGYEVLSHAEGETVGWGWPGFKVMFVMAEPGPGQIEVEGMIFTLEHVRGANEPVDLCLSLCEQEGRIFGAFEYDAAQFEAAMISTMSEHYKTLLAGLISQPDTKLLDLPLAVEKDRLEVDSLSRAQSASDAEDQFAF